MKDFLIVVNALNIKQVCPSTWVTEDSKHVRIPPEGSTTNLKQAVINIITAEENWETIPRLKIIKENGFETMK